VDFFYFPDTFISQSAILLSKNNFKKYVRYLRKNIILPLFQELSATFVGQPAKKILNEVAQHFASRFQEVAVHYIQLCISSSSTERQKSKVETSKSLSVYYIIILCFVIFLTISFLLGIYIC
jgi:predicted Na+-dependent transporter